MNLLIVTQKVNKEDDVLGFFHDWIEEFSKKYERVTVICLEEGEHDLPDNVKVLSLGKEHLEIKNWKLKITTRVSYIFKFLFYIFRFRREYEYVLVHMNPEYVVLGGWFWRLLGKKVALWYNHAKGGGKVRFASLFAHHIFYTSEYAYTRRFKKARIMPAGIDVHKFILPEAKNRKKNSILLLGRISPVKHVDVMIKALSSLSERGVDFTVSVYGEPTDSDIDKKYFNEIKNLAKPLLKKNIITFNKGVPNYKTPEIYNTHDIFINATHKGSLDKTILESSSSGTIPIICNESFKEIFPKELFFKEDNAIDLANTLQFLFLLSDNQKDQIRQQLREKVMKEHGLQKLIETIVNVFNE